jgi:hypothetical protein
MEKRRLDQLLGLKMWVARPAIYGKLMEKRGL